jgi:hypothetical protein
MTHEQTLAWMAGILEGEGCIGVYKDHRLNRNGYTLRVSVHNTDPTIIDVFERILGGSVHVARGTQRIGKRPVYQWYMGGLKGAAALKALRPYMLSASKTAQADAAMLYAERYSGHPVGVKGRRGIQARTPEQRADQARFHADLRALKRA